MWLDFLECPTNGTTVIIAVDSIRSGSRMGQGHSPSCFETSNHQPQAQIFVAWNTSCIYKQGAPAHLLLMYSSCFFHMFFNVFPCTFKVLLLHVVIAWRDCPSQHPLPNCYGFSIFLDKSMETMPLTHTLLRQTINPSIKSENLVSHDHVGMTMSWFVFLDHKYRYKCPRPGLEEAMQMPHTTTVYIHMHANSFLLPYFPLPFRECCISNPYQSFKCNQANAFLSK